jgi:hypothetical protein
MSFRSPSGKPILLGVLAALCGCSGEEEQNRAASMTPAQISREIEATHQLKPEDDPATPLVLQPGDWKTEFGEPGCSFVQPKGVTLLANGSHAVLRLRKQVFSLRAAGPVDRSAGFFAAGPVTVSVGVLAKQGSQAGQSRMAVRVPDAKEPIAVEGRWICA